MKKAFWVVIILLFISILGNFIGLYVLDKALYYWDFIRYVEREYPNEGLHLRNSGEIRSANVDKLGVFIGGSLVRYWFLPDEFPMHIVIKGGIEEKISTTYERFGDTVIKAGTDYVLINAGFCEIHTAVHSGRDAMPVIEKNFEYAKKIVAQSRANKIVPILTTLTPVRPRFLFPRMRRLDYSARHKREENEALEAFNDLLRNLSKEEGIALIDFHRAFSDEKGELIRRYAVTDGEHLNYEGYIFLSQFLKEELEKILNHENTEGRKHEN